MHMADFGDCLGGESCLDLKPATDVSDADYAYKPPASSASATRLSLNLRRKIGKEDAAAAAERKFPPRISSLVRVEDHEAAWVMRKYYTADGRLVIREEKVRRHEYLHAHRADGRLVMKLVAEDDDDDEEDEEEEEEEEEECGGGDGVEEEIGDCVGNVAVTDAVSEGIGDLTVEDDEGIGDPTVEDAFPEHCKYDGIGATVCGGGGGFGAAAVVPTPLHI